MERTFSRIEIAGWASVIGAVALVVGGLLFLLEGTISTWVFLCVLIGVGCLALWIWWAPAEFQAWLAGRQTRFGTTSILITILFIGLVVFAYVLVDRANITADLTSRQHYSLNAPTINGIDQLQERGYSIRLVGFFSRNKLREQETADLLLRLYEAEGDGSIEVEYIDPDEQPHVASQYGYQPGYDGHMFLAVLDTTGEPNFQVAPPLYLGEVNERAITTGLLTIASAGQFKVYFTTGHGELSLDRTDEIGLSSLRASLVGQGVIVESLQLLDVVNTGIPEDASAVLIVGARVPFVEEEVQAIADYIDRGGRLAIFADPPEVDLGLASVNTFLEAGSPLSNYLWDEFGIRVRSDVVVDKQSNLGSDFTLIIDTIVPHETILLDYEDAPIIMRLVRSIELTENPDSRQSKYSLEPLLYSSSGSYAETNLDRMVTNSETRQEENDPSGPLLTAVAVRRNLEFQEEKQARLFIIGDSDALRNEFVQTFPGNNVLWSDTVDWLTGFSQSVKFSPISDPTLLPLVVSDQERSTIAYITMLILPGIVLLNGVVVWWYRRR